MAKRTPEQLHADIAIPQALERWRLHMDRQMAALSAKYPDNERLTWPQLKQEAEIYTADNLASVPMLQAAASAAGIPTAALAATVLTNAANFETATGTLTGQRIAGDAQIKATTNQSELASVLTGLGL